MTINLTAIIITTIICTAIVCIVYINKDKPTEPRSRYMITGYQPKPRQGEEPPKVIHGGSNAYKPRPEVHKDDPDSV